MIFDHSFLCVLFFYSFEQTSSIGSQAATTTWIYEIQQTNKKKKTNCLKENAVCQSANSSFICILFIIDWCRIAKKKTFCPPINEKIFIKRGGTRRQNTWSWCRHVWHWSMLTKSNSFVSRYIIDPIRITVVFFLFYHSSFIQFSFFVFKFTRNERVKKASTVLLYKTFRFIFFRFVFFWYEQTRAATDDGINKRGSRLKTFRFRSYNQSTLGKGLRFTKRTKPSPLKN